MDGNVPDIGHDVGDALNLQQQDADFRPIFDQGPIFDQDGYYAEERIEWINEGQFILHLGRIEDQMDEHLAHVNAAIADFDDMIEQISVSNSEDSGYAGSISELSDVPSHFSAFSDELRRNEQCHFGFVARPEHVARGDMNADVHEPVHDARELGDNISNNPPENEDMLARGDMYADVHESVYDASELYDDTSNHPPESAEEIMARLEAQGWARIVIPGMNIDHHEATNDAASLYCLRYENEDERASAAGLEDILEAESVPNAQLNPWMDNGRAEASRFEEFLKAERAQKIDIMQWMHSDKAGMDQPSRKRKREMEECLDYVDNEQVLSNELTNSQNDTAISKRRKITRSNSAVDVSDPALY